MVAAMITTKTNTPVEGARGRAIKFTAQAIEKIKELRDQGKSRDEIANLLGVTMGSLQVTCSRLGISLRRSTSRNRSTRHSLDGRGMSPGAGVISHTPEQETEEVSQTARRIAPLPQFTITIRYKGRELASELPLSSHAIAALTFYAMSRDLEIADLLAQVLAAVIKKDMIQEILRDEVPSSAG
jgi:hypothetical protein